MKTRKISYFVAILSVLSCLFSIQVQAATLDVGPSGYPYSTIQEAIDAANNGDTVLVHDGTYMENVTFSGKAITVRSENGPESTIIDGNESGSVVIFNSGEGSDSVLDGFTIQSGLAHLGGGIYCSGTSPTITNCVISGNKTSSGGKGGGIYCVSSSSSPLISNCTISGNQARGTNGNGGGIYCGLYSHPDITNCTITGNEAEAGGGINCYASRADITNCIISGNTAYSLGGGIHCYYYDPKITNCIITGNTVTGTTAGTGGGGLHCHECSPTMTNCTISGNTGNSCGGGILCANASPTVVNSILWGNKAWGNPNEICLLGSSSIDITYTDIEGGYTGIGNLDDDPKFVDAANGDFHLSPDSPCINKGTTSGAPEYDFEGDPRLSSVGGDDLPDMGADEFRALPPAPSNLEAHQIPGQIHIFWEDNSDNESGFILEFKRAGLLIWLKLATLGSNVCSFQMDNPILNETYYFRVYAYNDQGNSDYSNEASVFIYGLIQPLSIHAPNGGEVWSPGSAQQITWAKGISPCLRVTIQYSIDGGCSWISPPIATNILNTGSYSWTVPNTPSTNCIVKVQDAADGFPYDLSNKPFTIELLPCNGDFDQDGDVDGSDLAALAANPDLLDLSLFAADFGRTNCPITVTLNSTRGLDGYVTSTGSAVTWSQAMVGDNSANIAVRGFLSFDISSIPPSANIISATLRAYQEGVNGTPYADLGNVIVDHLDYGTTLDGTDYDLAALQSNVGSLSNNAAIEYKTLDVTARVKADINDGRARSQYRLLLPTPTDSDNFEDAVFFTSANCCTSNLPELVITYQVPTAP